MACWSKVFGAGIAVTALTWSSRPMLVYRIVMRMSLWQSQLTGFYDEVTAAQQLGDLSVPPCHVYTGSCCFGLERDASPLEALFEHQQVCRYIRSIIDMVFREQWARIKGHRFRPKATYPIPMARPIRPTVIDLSEKS